MKRKQFIYKKPSLREKKVKITYFFSKVSSYDNLDLLLGDDKLLAYVPCFLGETKILMSDGSLKQIKDIKEGNEVFSYDFTTKNLVKSNVLKLKIKENNPGGYLLINNILKVTSDHRIWKNNAVWEEAKNFKIGDWFTDSKGNKVELKIVSPVPGVFTVFNLYLDGELNNFFAEDILVHNICF